MLYFNISGNFAKISDKLRNRCDDICLSSLKSNSWHFSSGKASPKVEEGKSQIFHIFKSRKDARRLYIGISITSWWSGFCHKRRINCYLKIIYFNKNTKEYSNYCIYVPLIPHE